MQSVYSIAPADWATNDLMKILVGLGILNPVIFKD